MLLFKLFACITALIIPTWAAIPITDLKISIFDSCPRDFERGVMKVMDSTRKFHAKHNVSSLLDMAAQCIQYVGELMSTVVPLRNTMVEHSDWRNLFTIAIGREVSQEIVENELRRVKSTTETVETKIKSIDENNPDRLNRESVALIVHSELDKLLNFFDLKTSSMLKFPLLGAPPLIEMASLISIFAPFAKSLIPYNLQLSCKMRDILIDYRLRTLNARLHKIYTVSSKGHHASIFKIKIEVMSMPYKEHGSNRSESAVIDCQRGQCKAPKQLKAKEFCLKDEFGAEEFQVNDDTTTCVKDYVSMVKRAVDDLFPIDLLNKVCVESKKKIPSGFGWLTVNMQTAFTFGEQDGTTCKVYSRWGCNSVIEFYINDEKQLTSSQVKDKYMYDADITFTTHKISKNARIEIKIWDKKSAFWEKNALILHSKGDVQSFLSEPLRTGAVIDGKQNAIEIISFWQDDYKDAV